MEDLKKQYGDMKEIDLQDKGLRSFDRIAREYKVQYAVYKTAKGQYQICLLYTSFYVLYLMFVLHTRLQRIL